MTLPDTLKKLADRHLDTLCEKQPDNLAQWEGHEREALRRKLGLSDFIASSVEHDDALLPWLKEHLVEPARSDSYRVTLAEILAGQTDENGAMRELRRFRRREMVWLAWKDFNGDIDLEAGLNHLSELAEAMIIESYHWLYADCCKQWGTPCNAAGDPQPMLILGMGKLGGGELNFSSDIDLIFTYPENGETQGARRSIANPQFFTRLGQRLIKLLDQQTFDGFCYRVDMRLRPFGDSGPLVMSFAALEDYYQEQGRDWERYAMIKARVMGREQFDCYQELRQLLRPFVFRRYIDFSAVQSLRRMKAMISSEVRRRGLHDNIKLGPGGIREIEFIAQSFQLIRGGREPSLRKRGLLETLQAIGDLGLLPESDVSGLKAAYLFLRRMENLLQAIADKQTQTLPDIDRDQSRLCIAMGFVSWDALMAERQQHMDTVHDVFDSLIGDDEQESESDVPPACQELWDMAGRNPEILASIFTDTGVSCPESMAAKLSDFKKELAKRTLGPRGREVLTRLMPKLLSKVIEPGRSCPDELLGRLTHLIVRIASRTTYMELLDEHPAAIAQLVRLCAASPMVAEKLSTYPVLLDELLDPRELYNPLSLDQYKTELREFLARIPEEDMEQQMEALRQFKQIQLLKIAAADIAGVLPLMKVSDHLTYLAEAIIDAAVSQAWVQTAAKYGEPSHLSGRDGRGFAVIGYGKVGGWELGYGSDLDVVFIHDCPDNVYTNGKKEIDGRQFYLRLAQRVVHLFSTRTTSGVLYELDTRLRPSGTSGMLVTTLESFREYQEQEAWTWEHQALVRARMVYGDSQLAAGFEKVRHDILCADRETEKLRQDVAEMREKMREHLGSKTAGVFKIKQDRGGITDIEFIAQYLVLNHSCKEPKLTRWSDNVRIFEDCANYGIVEQGQAIALRDTYVTLRDKMHRLALADNDAEVPDSTLVEERNVVSDAWDNWLAREQSTE